MGYGRLDEAVSLATDALTQARASLEASERIAQAAAAYRAATAAQQQAEMSLVDALHAGRAAGIALRPLGVLAGVSHGTVDDMLKRHPRS